MEGFQVYSQPEVEQQIKDDFANYAMKFLEANGRVISTLLLEECSEKEMEKQVRYLKSLLGELSWIKVLEEYTMFYHFKWGFTRFVSLSRDFHYCNPRFALYMADEADATSEALLRFVREVENEPHYGADLYFREHDCTKTAWAQLKIIEAVYKPFVENEFRAKYKDVEESCNDLGQLAKSMLKFCGPPSSISLQLRKFLNLYDKLFEFHDEDDLYRRLPPSFALKHVLKTDLVRSYIAECVCKGMTSMAAILVEANEFIERTELKVLPEINIDYVRQVLENRPDLCFVPGDKTVWLLDKSAWNKPFRLCIVNFFLKHLLNNRIRYQDCHTVLVKGLRDIASVFQGDTFISIASLLHLDGSFSFRDGNVQSNVGGSRPGLRSLPPIHVTVDFEKYNTPVPEDMKQGYYFGKVFLLAERSALIQFAYDPSQTHQHNQTVTSIVWAYCDLRAVCFNGQEGCSPEGRLSEGDTVCISTDFVEYRSLKNPLTLQALEMNTVKYLADNLSYASYIKKRQYFVAVPL